MKLRLLPLIPVLTLGFPAFSAENAPAPAVEAPRPAVEAPMSVGSYLSARFARSTNQLDAADRSYDELLSENPDRPEILLKSIKIKLARGDVEMAIRLAGKPSMMKESDTPLLTVLRAVTAMKKGDNASVPGILGTAKAPGIYMALFPLLSAWSTQDPAAAKHVLDQAEKDEPRLADLLGYHRGLMACQRDNQVEAAKHFAAVIDRKDSPFAPRARLAAMECGRGAETKQPAEEVLSEDSPATGLKPRNALDGAAEALANAGAFAAVLGARDDGYALMQMALYLHPEFHQARYELGRLQENEGLLDEARETYQAIPKTSSVYFSAQTQIAKLLRKQNKTDEAIAALRALVVERPKELGIYMQMGAILRDDKRYAEAAEVYSQAIATVEKPEARHWPLFFFRGACLERSKQWEKAEADLLKALELKPEEPEVLNYLGYSWLDQGLHGEKAMEYIARAVKQRPNEPHILDSYGWAFYLKNDLDNATRYLERAVELMPYDPTVNDHLGDVYWRTGRKVEARFQWERALSFKPEKDEVAAIREKLEKGLSGGPQKAEKE
ncbi:MAG: tetratricopeptide repeat protein [Alphaproteobacteria bacterium]|nr:tetratricopeptide repeat protein [Alphaproteobacteria bacterium]